MKEKAVWDSLPTAVRVAACGYRSVTGNEVFYTDKLSAEEARAQYAGEEMGTLVSPSVLVEMDEGERILLSVPISDHSRADALLAACHENGLEQARIVWELTFL